MQKPELRSIFFTNQNKKLMTHIRGHVTDKPSSPGKLKLGLLSNPSKNKMEFIPPTWECHVGDDIGFHIMTIGGIHIATDIVRWQDHVDAEVLFMKHLKDILPSPSFGKLEELVDLTTRKIKVSDSIVKATLGYMYTPEHESVINLTLRYLIGSDFTTHYVKGSRLKTKAEFDRDVARYF
jgi:hypothetical protein